MAIENKQIIYEQAFSSTDINILEESVTPGGQYKCVFRAKLQEADVVNNNKRVYPADTLESVYNQLKEKAVARKLVGELDHPQPSGDQASKIKRSSTISLERACILITDVEFDGTALYGICETLSNRAGMDLYCLLKDGVTIGFSLRAFGETKNKGGGVVEVTANGIRALTYDVVANPSHDSSIITEMISENDDARAIINELKLEVLEERSNMQAAGMLLEENGFSGLSAQINENTPQKVCIGNICTVAPLEEAIEYLVGELVNDKSIPDIKVKKF